MNSKVNKLFLEVIQDLSINEGQKEIKEKVLLLQKLVCTVPVKKIVSKVVKKSFTIEMIEGERESKISFDSEKALESFMKVKQKERTILNMLMSIKKRSKKRA